MDLSRKHESDAATPPKVLVVDDVVLVRLLVADYLRGCGFHVLEASNADEAILVLGAQIPVDVVFTDVNMPGTLDGFALARWVRENCPQVKTVLGSGVSGIAAKAAALCHEGPIVSKPYKLVELNRQLREALGQKPAE